MVPKRVSIYHPLGFNWHLLEGAGMYVRSLFCEIHFGCHFGFVNSAHMLQVWYCTVCILRTICHQDQRHSCTQRVHGIGIFTYIQLIFVYS